MKRAGFTLPEVLVSTSIIGIILLCSISLMALVSSALFDSQTEARNRSNLADNVYYITREIQSADSVKLSADNKTLWIRQRGTSAYTLVYTIKDGIPTGSFCFQDQKMMDVDYQQSTFQVMDETLQIVLAVYKTDLEYGGEPKRIVMNIMPRCAFDVEVGQ